MMDTFDEAVTCCSYEYLSSTVATIRFLTINMISYNVAGDAAAPAAAAKAAAPVEEEVDALDGK